MEPVRVGGVGLSSVPPDIADPIRCHPLHLGADEILHLLNNTAVPASSNHADSSLRMGKIPDKIIGRPATKQLRATLDEHERGRLRTWRPPESATVVVETEARAELGRLACGCGGHPETVALQRTPSGTAALWWRCVATSVASWPRWRLWCHHVLAVGVLPRRRDGEASIGAALVRTIAVDVGVYALAFHTPIDDDLPLGETIDDGLPWVTRSPARSWPGCRFPVGLERTLPCQALVSGRRPGRDGDGERVGGSAYRRRRTWSDAKVG
ncbi:MAG: hypothetical protein ACFCVK_17750 [Acidimicrobiales bacterium]